MSDLEAISGVNERGEGSVRIAVLRDGKELAVLQATPGEARQIAQQIAEAAEAAETDSFIFQCFESKLHMHPEQIGAFLLEFRELRELSRNAKTAGA